MEIQQDPEPPEATPRTLLVYETIDQRCPYRAWISSMKDKSAAFRIAARLKRVAADNLGDCRSVGDGVLELRFHFGPGYRVYFALHGKRIVVLLCAGTKSSQPKDIEAAKAYWADWLERAKGGSA